jgi:hypothetical protein
MGRRNVFVVGLDEAHRHHLGRVPLVRDSCELLAVSSPAELRDWRRTPLQKMVERAIESIEGAGRTVDAITGFGGFPVAPMVALLCRHYALPGPSLESVVACEHAAWSRLLQSSASPVNVPPFATVDAFDAAGLDAVGLPFPFLVRPVNALADDLSFRIAAPRDLEAAGAELRAQLPSFLPAFDDLLAHVEIPRSIVGVGGRHCIAEPIVGGHRCRVESHAFGEEIHTYGVVDLVPHALDATLARCEYPSHLPFPLQDELKEIVSHLGRAFGFWSTTFNVEIVCDTATGELWVSDVRVGPAHLEADLFEMVDGTSGYAVAVDLALGRRPAFVHGRGRYGCAAKFLVRTWDDTVVTRVPTTAELEMIRRAMPAADVRVRAATGDRRRRAGRERDLAWISIGGSDAERLREGYEVCKPMLRFGFSEPGTRWH